MARLSPGGLTALWALFMRVTSSPRSTALPSSRIPIRISRSKTRCPRRSRTTLFAEMPPNDAVLEGQAPGSHLRFTLPAPLAQSAHLRGLEGRAPRLPRCLPGFPRSDIYHRAHPAGPWLQADSRQSRLDVVANELNVQRDMGTTDRVLLSDNFTYWGGDGPAIPTRLSNFIHRARSYKSSFTEKEIAKLVAWVQSPAVSKKLGVSLG
jgi:hypothetical protein